MDNITIGKTVSIRSKGHDEYWLQDRICENPSVLNLGDLELLAKEKSQNGGGRLDILLKEPTENAMYEVEVMLGETDESHIIRTIEYWDREKRKYPKRSHTAVLVAETINARFFNVIHLFSHAIPIIAIQAQLIETANGSILHFSTVLNTYEEPEDLPNSEAIPYGENEWQKDYPWVLDAANTLLGILKPAYPIAKLHYVYSYISIAVNKGDRRFWFYRRRNPKCALEIGFSDSVMPKATALLDAADISYIKKTDSLSLTTDSHALKNNTELMVKIGELNKESWGE